MRYKKKKILADRVSGRVSGLVLFGVALASSLLCWAAPPTATVSPIHPVTLPQWGSPSSAAESRFQPFSGTRGMVVADDRIAAEWGAEILRKGGNAIDAAVATAFSLSVTRPHYASLGGGGFLLYCPKPPLRSKQVSAPKAPPCYSIDFREKASLAARRDLYFKNGKATPESSQTGALAVAVPGVPAGLLMALEKFGTLPRKLLLSRPIQLAKKGFRLSTHTETAAIDRWTEMNAAARQIFGCRTTRNSPLAPCPPGAWIKQADLGRVLEEISEKGTPGFYQGPTAQKIVRGIQAAGGLLSVQDFKSYQPVFRVPLKMTLAKEFTRPGFPGSATSALEIVAMPPPSSGGTILLQLLSYATMAAQTGQLSHGAESVETIHSLAHAMGLAYADRAEFLGDPDQVQIRLDRLLNPAYLQNRWKTYSPDRATLLEGTEEEKTQRVHGTEPTETTHFSVIDREGNAVAITVTVNANFGSGFVPPGTGVVMNDQMDDFSIHPGTPNQWGLIGNEANAIAPGKRPLSSMTPAILRDSEGRVRIVIGAAGGPRIPTAVFLALMNRIYFGMSLPDAVFAPRFHEQWKPPLLDLEINGFGEATRARLIQKGYRLNVLPKLGKLHTLERFSNQRVWGVADPRGEGAAVAE